MRLQGGMLFDTGGGFTVANKNLDECNGRSLKLARCDRAALPPEDLGKY